jgi:hypothetical protein
MKTITSRQIASVKRTAQNVNPMVVKKTKLLAKIDSINAELEELNTQINSWESAIIAMTGTTSEQLVRKVISPVYDIDGNPKLDIKGQQVMVTKYEINPEIVSYDEDKKVYNILTMEDTKETASSDIEDFNI